MTQSYFSNMNTNNSLLIGNKYNKQISKKIFDN